MELNKRPLFSVLMANYNNANYIKESIESVINQTYNNWELVIIDDCSTDNSLELLDKYEDKRIKIYHQNRNMGCGFSKHHAAKLANGEILAFLDPDDTLHKDALQIMVDSHIENPKICLINSDHYVCDENLAIKRLSYGASEIPKTENYLTYAKGITAFASFKKEAYQNSLGINPNFRRAVDQDLYYKLEEQGETKFIDIPLYYYRIHTKGISTFDNLSKSRYWLVKAKEDAYKRRKSNSGIKNIRKSELRAWWSILFASKASDALRYNNYCGFIYWLFKSFVKSPFDKYWILKSKAIIVNTYLHRALKKVNG